MELDFFADEDYDGEISKEKVPDYYMSKVQKCFEQANQKMLGSKGEKLQISIKKPTSSKITCNQNVRKIGIGSSKMRSHSKKYAQILIVPLLHMKFCI